MSELTDCGLKEVFEFCNGKSNKGIGEGEFLTYGSNGIIGSSEKSNYENAIILGRVGAYCGSVMKCTDKFWATDNTIVLKPKEHFDLTYLYYHLSKVPLRSYAGGAAQPLITHGILSGIKIKVPPLPTQKRIADILSAYDDLIENNNRRIALLEQAARHLYKEWFVRFKFPGHEKVKVVDGVPEGWERKTLGEVCELKYGKALKATERIEGQYEVYGSSGAVGTHNQFLVEGPGIIVGRKGNVGSTYWSWENFYPIDTVYYIDKEQSNYWLYITLENV